MSFWSLQRISDDLLHGRVSPSAQLGYFIGFGAFEIFLWNADIAGWNSPSTGIQVLDDFVSMSIWLITMCGLGFAFRANGGNGGRDFAVRVLALSWPIRLRLVLWFLVLSVPAIAILGFVRGFFSLPASVRLGSHTMPYVFLLFVVAHYIWLNARLKALRNAGGA